MEDNLKKAREALDQQNIRFRKGLGADVSFLILVLILFFVNIYSYFKLQGNPPAARLFIFVILYFFLGWNVYEIVKNSLGLWGINKTDELLGDIRSTKSEALKVPTSTFFSGFWYDVIDKDISEYVSPLSFHLKKKKENLLSLNIRYAFWDFLVLSSGIALFVAQAIYAGDKSSAYNFWSWEAIVGLIVMIVFILFTVLYLIPRQYIINRQIRLNNMKKLSEDEYYALNKFWYVEKVLSKFWNRDKK